MARKAIKHGGIAFFLSFFFLAFLSLVHLAALPDLWDSFARSALWEFVIGFAFGAWLAHTFLREHFRVLIHELKHEIISHLAGNTSRGMKIHRHSGRFLYSYPKRNEGYNAFIAIAPYWLPIFTFLAMIVTAIFFRHEHEAAVLAIGVAYGADSLCHLRDIGPHQTDFTDLRGGFISGLLYVFLINLTVLSALLGWVFQGLFGLKYLLYALSQAVLQLGALFFPVG